MYGNVLLPIPPEPVFTVIGKVLPSPFVNVIVLRLTDAVVKRELVLVLAPAPPFKAYEAVIAYEEVPINCFAVTELDTKSDPVIVASLSDTNPLRAINSCAI